VVVVRDTMGGPEGGILGVVRAGLQCVVVLLVFQELCICLFGHTFKRVG
jgi:hypothetical protein